MQHIIHWFDRNLLWLASKVQVLFFCNDYLGSAEQTGQNVLKKEIHSVYNYLYIHSIWILYINCIHNVYDVQFFCIRTDVCNVYKMYPKMYTKCIRHFNKLFGIHFPYKMYTKYIQNVCVKMYLIFEQTFVYKMYKTCFCIKHIPHFDKLLYIFCIQNLVGIVLVS